MHNTIARKIPHERILIRTRLVELFKKKLLPIVYRGKK